MSVELHSVNVPSPWVKSEQMRFQPDRRTDLGRNNDLINSISSNNHSHEMLKVERDTFVQMQFMLITTLSSNCFQAFSNRMAKRKEQCFIALFHIARLGLPSKTFIFR